MTLSTIMRVCSATRGDRRTTRETVARETPATRAMSSNVGRFVLTAHLPRLSFILLPVPGTTLMSSLGQQSNLNLDEAGTEHH